MRAEPCAAVVLIGTCQPCQERALSPMPVRAMARSPEVTCSPEATTASYSRWSWSDAASLHQADQLVGLPRHGRDDDRDLVAGLDLAPDVHRDVADALDGRDGRAAEFHHETGTAGHAAAGLHARRAGRQKGGREAGRRSRGGYRKGGGKARRAPAPGRVGAGRALVRGALPGGSPSRLGAFLLPTPSDDGARDRRECARAARRRDKAWRPEAHRQCRLECPPAARPTRTRRARGAT